MGMVNNMGGSLGIYSTRFVTKNAVILSIRCDRNDRERIAHCIQETFLAEPFA